jgi:hypothetical protein
MRAALILLLATLATPALAEQTRPVVVELFTSQGCSSCPPADALLTQLATRPDVLPLAFHVTYWNGLGWRDPYSLDAATARQRAYQRQLDADNIYTPQMIVDGQTDVVGSDRRAVERAIASARARMNVPLSLSADAGGVHVDIGEGQGSAALLLIGYDGTHQTAVGRGENAGRKLTESNIVRSFSVLAGWNGSAQHVQAAVPQGEHVVAILQDGNGHILATAQLARPAS